jgi:hypothetical protein
MQTTRTAQGLIEEARTRNPGFRNTGMPDGALLLALNTKQRTLLSQYADAIAPIVGQSVQTAAQVAGSLVGVSPAGVPQYITTIGVGYPVTFSANGVPIFSQLGASVNLDPYGVSGGVPGFPLPDDCVRLVWVSAIFADNSQADVAIVPERSRYQMTQPDLACFINGNRLVPIRFTNTAQPTVAPDWWTQVTSVITSYLAMQTLTSLAQVLTIPAFLHEPLIAHIAYTLALNTEGVKPDFYLTQSKDADAALLSAGRDLLGSVTQTSVIYHP